MTNLIIQTKAATLRTKLTTELGHYTKSSQYGIWTSNPSKGQIVLNVESGQETQPEVVPATGLMALVLGGPGLGIHGVISRPTMITLAVEVLITVYL